MRKIAKIFLLTASIGVLVFGVLASRIYSFGNTRSEASADAAIVLGAAVWSTGVSPVFRERINHGIDLYRTGKVRKLIFTGSQGNPGEPTESSAARDYALTERSSRAGHFDRREISYDVREHPVRETSR